MFIRRLGLSLILGLPAIAVAETPWLYLTSEGAWVGATYQPPANQDAWTLSVPTQAGTLWVEDEASLDYWVRERDTTPTDLSPGAEVWIPPAVAGPAGLGAGDYEVVQVLAFGVTARSSADTDELVVLTPEVLRASEIAVAEAPADNLLLYDAGSDERRIAWWQNTVTGQVVYRLDVQNETSGALTQSLLVDNGGEALSIAGLSFQETSESAGTVMRASVERAAMSDSAEQVTGQMAVIRSPVERTLAADSLTTVPVASQAVDLQYEYHHRLYLGSRLDAMPAEQTLVVASTEGDNLPRLAGSVSVNWFDRARAREETRYPAGNPDRARLDLGRSPLVSASLVLRDKGETGELTVLNRTEQTVGWEGILYWQGENGRQEYRISTRLPAGRTVWSLERNGDRLNVSDSVGN